ncbi:MAG TPA: DUF4199 domain-containing protein [Ignavibacteria bacterium]|nr:DUF4199 domain-containing protein [Ignavibacteria bacterium]
MKKTALTFGLIASAIIIFYSFIFYLIFGDVNTMTPGKMTVMEVFGYLRIITLIIAIFFAMKSLRKDPNNSTYMSVVKTGLMVALIVSVFIGIGETVYTALNPGLYDKYGEMEIQSLQEKGVSPEGIAEERKMREDLRWMANPVMAGIFCFLGIFVIGVIVALILGIFLKANTVAQARI